MYHARVRGLGSIRRWLAGVGGRYLKVFGVVSALSLIALNIFITGSNTSAISKGDGALVYGVASNTTPQAHTYIGSSNSFLSAGGTVSGTTPQNMIMRASSTKQEMIAGYTNSSGTLQIMCFDGTAWTNEWTVTVGGTGTTRAFDIAYETNTGDVIVLYSTDVTSTNELAYRTKGGSSGCGSANWSGASNLDPVRTSGAVAWVKLAPDARGSSNLIAAMWADSGSAASAMIWSGSAWGNEPSAALATTGSLLEKVGATQDVESFDLAYESLSGDLLIVWSISGTGTTNLIKYTTCTGGTSNCSWPGTLISNVGTVSDGGTNLDIASNPASDQISMVALDNGGLANSCDLVAGYWSGSGWTGQANVDVTAECPAAGRKIVATAWLVNGSATRRVITYDDSSGTGISYKYSAGSASLTSPSDFSASPALNDVRNWYDFQMDPFHQERTMLTAADSTNSLFAKRLTMDGSGNLSWSDAEGGSVLTSSLAQANGGDFSFAYWRATSVFEQSAYRWYNNADSVQPGTALANQNTAASMTNNSAIVRLRMALTVSAADLDAASQAFTLQYATSTSGPWTDIDNPPDTWCNDTTGVTCTTSWAARKKVTINNSASTENLTNFPLLVKLNSSRIDYAKTQSSGQDIRFVDPSDTNTVLPHEIETWNEAGDSYVWVKVPQINSGSTTDYIYMYYDNASASDGQDAVNVWDSNFKGVWHLKEGPTTGAPQMQDSTASNYDGTTNGMEAGDQVAGQVNGSLQFDGTTAEYVNVGHQTNLYSSTAYTASCWVKPTSGSGTRRFFFSDADTTTAHVSFSFEVNDANQASTAVTTTGQSAVVSSSTAINLDTWYHIGAVWSSSNTLTLYINGQSEGTPATNGAAMPPFTSVGNTAMARLGSYTGGFNFPGQMDECRYSNANRSAEWVEADYINQNDSMNSFGSEEDQTSDDSEGIWRFYNNPTPAGGATISSTLLAGSTVNETYQEANPTAANPNAIPITGKGEWDFALDPSGVCGGTYYFRMVKDDGTALTTYTVYPQLVVDLPQIVPVDKALRHGAWFDDEVEQPYGCEWVSD